MTWSLSPDLECRGGVRGNFYTSEFGGRQNGECVGKRGQCLETVNALKYAAPEKESHTCPQVVTSSVHRRLSGKLDMKTCWIDMSGVDVEGPRIQLVKLQASSLRGSRLFHEKE